MNSADSTDCPAFGYREHELEAECASLRAERDHWRDCAVREREMVMSDAYKHVKERIDKVVDETDRMLGAAQALAAATALCTASEARAEAAELVRDQAVEALRAIVRADDAKWRERWRSRGAIQSVALTESISRASKFLDGAASTEKDKPAMTRWERKQVDAMERDLPTDTPDPVGLCPDDGTCHHECWTFTGNECWRVHNAGPLSGVFPGNEWPKDAKRRASTVGSDE